MLSGSTENMLHCDAVIFF